MPTIKELKKQKPDDYSMKIEKIESSKHHIKQRALMEAGVIPNHPAISLFSGSQGGGKSTLVANLLTKKHMYGLSLESINRTESRHPKPRPYFDAIFLFIGSDDDMYDRLIEDGTIRPEHVKHSPKPDDIQHVIDEQKRLIADVEGDLSKAPKILCIFDDIINDRKLITSRPFLELFVKGRHLNSSTWLLCQYLNLCPKSCRLQANFLFVFKCNRAEMMVLGDQFCPPDMTKQDFYKMVMDTTSDNEESKNNFLLIVKRAPIDKRFRQNLDKYVVVGKSELKDDSAEKLKEIKARLAREIKMDYSSSSESDEKPHKKKEATFTANIETPPADNRKVITTRKKEQTLTFGSMHTQLGKMRFQ